MTSLAIGEPSVPTSCLTRHALLYPGCQGTTSLGPGTVGGGFLCSACYARAGMTGANSEATDARERLGKSAALFKGSHKERPKEPTHCDSCGKGLGVNWFSLYDKAYCSPCFHSKFWTPFQSVPDKATDPQEPLGKSAAPSKKPPKVRPKTR